LRDYCEARLLDETLPVRSGMDRAAIHSMWTAFLAGRSDVTWSRLWTLVALSAWLDANKVSL
jgi:hypothetical protein